MIRDAHLLGIKKDYLHRRQIFVSLCCLRPYSGVSTYMDQLWDRLLPQVSQGKCKLSQAIRNVIQLYVVLNSGDDNKGISSSFAYTDLYSAKFQDRSIAQLNAPKKKMLKRPSPYYIKNARCSYGFLCLVLGLDTLSSNSVILGVWDYMKPDSSTFFPTLSLKRRLK